MKLIKTLVLLLSVTFSSLVFSKININTATLDELVLLNGIGESKAELIIEYRDNNGDFKNIEDLTEVKGIGDKTVQNIADKITTSGKTDLSDL